MKRIIFVGCLIAVLAACNDNHDRGGAITTDSSYNNPSNSTGTDTATGTAPMSTDTTRRNSEDTTRR
jgi:hypothetical protein